jgi:transposase-like protein
MEEPTSARELFRGRHFDHEIIVLCVRWYLTSKLSSRDLVQMMAERGIVLAHTTILRWVQRYVPDFEKRWNHYARPVGDSWRVDETYIKVRGQWVYLYRAVDNEGRTVDFLLSKRRDVAAAKRFFSWATRQHGAPRVITLDAYAASHRAVAELKAAGTLARRVRIRSCAPRRHGEDSVLSFSPPRGQFPTRCTTHPEMVMEYLFRQPLRSFPQQRIGKYL